LIETFSRVNRKKASTRRVEKSPIPREIDEFSFHGILQPTTTKKQKEPPDTGGGRVFSFDASFGLLATRRRLRRRGCSCVLGSAFVV